MPRKILKSRKKRSKSRIKKRSRKQKVGKSFSNKKNRRHTRTPSANLEKELPELGFKTLTERIVESYRPCGEAGVIYDKRIEELLNEKINNEIQSIINKRKFKKMYDEMIDKRISDEILRRKEEKERELERNKFWF